MLKDIPYSILKQDVRAYEVLLLRDRHGNTFADIAREQEISAARVAQIYNRLKIKQIRLYLNHIAVTLGQESTSQVKTAFHAAYECYQDMTYACAYLEKKYRDILTEYRGGEPGMPAWFMKSMPPFQPKLSKKTIARVIELRETKKASYAAIAKELRVTQAKARHTYELFYHQQVLALVRALQENAGSDEEKMAIWDFYFEGGKSAKRRYDMLTTGS